MAAERNVSSVLEKLMGIDKLPNSYTSHRRHRVLSENYLRNIASTARREKALPFFYGSECDMDVTEDPVRFSVRENVIEYEDVHCRTGQSFNDGRSFSAFNSLSSDRNRNIFVSERINGVHSQKKRLSNSYNSIISPIQGSLSSKDIAKQISGQVMYTAWHSCAELSKSKPGTEKSSEIEEEKRMTSSAILVDSEKKNGASSYTSVKGSSTTILETQNAKKQISDIWRTSKFSQDEGLVTSCDGNGSFTFSTANVNERTVPSVPGARYLSKPALFPSAWVPRSKARYLTLDRNWCLRPDKKDEKHCSDLEQEEFGHKNVTATSEGSNCSMDLKKPCIHQEVPLILNKSVKLVDQHSSEETFRATESLKNISAISKLESHTCLKAHKITNKILCGHLEKEVLLDSTAESSRLNGNIAPISLEEEIADEGIKVENMPTKLLKENLSAKSTACILLGDRDSWLHQSKIKSNGSEPGSPVSSLEGPEACRHVFNSTLEPEDHSSVSDSLENDTHESGSEGFGMVVSSEEGDDGRSTDCYKKDLQIMEVDQTLIKESCDFSYIVDVVVESGLQIRNLEVESKTWWLQGYALDPLVFDLLEKKYGEHVPWAKAERRLLFDSMNSLLLEKVKPWLGLSTWREPLAKRFCLTQKVQDFIEDELWWLLVHQQEEAKKDTFDKVRRIEMEWLDLEEDTDMIAKDIQNLLIDELIEEFVYTELCFC